MTEVHDVAARGFGAQAAAYDRSRPSYPADAISWLTEHLGIAAGRRVMDLAAGTGKLTTLLTGSGAELLAIEPVAGMREQFRAALPQVPLLAGVAEALPLAAACVDAVVVAQAFHWFDSARALAELHRVVRPGGRLALIWNARDRSVPWVDQVWSVMDRVEKNAPWRDHRDGTAGGGQQDRRSERHVTAGTGWSAWTEATFFHVHHVTHEQVLERLASVSHIAVLTPAELGAVLDEVRTILRDHPQTRDSATLAIGYRVDVMYAERLG